MSAIGPHYEPFYWDVIEGCSVHPTHSALLPPTGLRYRLKSRAGQPFQDITPSWGSVPSAPPCPFCGGAAFTVAHCPNCGAPHQAVTT